MNEYLNSRAVRRFSVAFADSVRRPSVFADPRVAVPSGCLDRGCILSPDRDPWVARLSVQRQCMNVHLIRRAVRRFAVFADSVRASGDPRVAVSSGCLASGCGYPGPRPLGRLVVCAKRAHEAETVRARRQEAFLESDAVCASGYPRVAVPGRSRRTYPLLGSCFSYNVSNREVASVARFPQLLRKFSSIESFAKATPFPSETSGWIAGVFRQTSYRRCVLSHRLRCPGDDRFGRYPIASCFDHRRRHAVG